MIPYYLDNRSNSRANTCKHTPSGVAIIRLKPARFGGVLVIHNNHVDRMASAGDGSFELLPYQLWKVRYWLTLAVTGNG